MKLIWINEIKEEFLFFLKKSKLDKNVLIWKDQWNEIRLKERMDLVDGLKIKESVLILILKIIKIE